MGAGKKSQRQSAKQQQQQLRTRTTRSSRGRVISPSDPETNSRQLTEQLRALGLYAAPTVGDGNCLFRALSDQLYGSASRHAQLRSRVCDWIGAHGDLYAPFVEDERGLDAHLRCMRENGTYGGHLELSAFAHMTGKNVKVIQPALVYVIGAGNDSSSAASSSTSEQQADAGPDEPSSGREKRQARRDRMRAEKGTPSKLADEDDEDEDGVPNTVYVAYHDWEHFSSIRNLRGPHAGLPMVKETRGETVPPPSMPSTPTKKVPRIKLRLSNPSTPASSSKPPSTVVSPPRSVAPSSMASAAPSSFASPTQVPLPASRSPSPLTGTPKRSFDESSLSSLEDVESGDAKRRRPSPLAPADDAEDTPELSAPGSASSRESTAFSSSLSELETTEDEGNMEEEEEEVVEEPPAPEPVPLTQRQRKALGLPKHRPGQRSAGTIVIPGGRFKRQPVSVAAPDEEWVRNGNGRVDVRGFRELKI
ncbi:hypothetical protein BD626DRAFT_438394 [Schizophyllum amplum]|uniref:OTU domain-containing protein n=1 Tax=Schizophyllum amplum TaxID=97359 RepID=A0A550C0E3_9AGAR|nr:hypothetical protein BD626DRAFT_438394 [Auriculariopsis ampla]